MDRNKVLRHQPGVTHCLFSFFFPLGFLRSERGAGLHCLLWVIWGNVWSPFLLYEVALLRCSLEALVRKPYAAHGSVWKVQ